MNRSRRSRRNRPPRRIRCWPDCRTNNSRRASDESQALFFAPCRVFSALGRRWSRMAGPDEMSSTTDDTETQIAAEEILARPGIFNSVMLKNVWLNKASRIDFRNFWFNSRVLPLDRGFISFDNSGELLINLVVVVHEGSMEKMGIVTDNVPLRSGTVF